MAYEQIPKLCKIVWDGRALRRDHEILPIVKRILAMEEEPNSHVEVRVLIRNGRIAGADWTEKERFSLSG